MFQVNKHILGSAWRKGKKGNLKVTKPIQNKLFLDEKYMKSLKKTNNFRIFPEGLLCPSNFGQTKGSRDDLKAHKIRRTRQKIMINLCCLKMQPQISNLAFFFFSFFKAWFVALEKYCGGFHYTRDINLIFREAKVMQLGTAWKEMKKKKRSFN